MITDRASFCRLLLEDRSVVVSQESVRPTPEFGPRALEVVGSLVLLGPLGMARRKLGLGCGWLRKDKHTRRLKKAMELTEQFTKARNVEPVQRCGSGDDMVFAVQAEPPIRIPTIALEDSGCDAAPTIQLRSECEQETIAIYAIQPSPTESSLDRATEISWTATHVEDIDGLRAIERENRRDQVESAISDVPALRHPPQCEPLLYVLIAK